MSSGICKCCGLWVQRNVGAVCKNCAQIQAKYGRCRHVDRTSGGVFATAPKREFYIAGGVANEDPSHAWHGTEDYLGEAIRTRASDLLLGFLQTPAADEIVACQELHHQQHGAIDWRQCADRDCRDLGRRCAEILVAKLAVLRGQQ